MSGGRVLTELNSGHPNGFQLGIVLGLGASVYVAGATAGHLWSFLERISARGMC